MRAILPILVVGALTQLGAQTPKTEAPATAYKPAPDPVFEEIIQIKTTPYKPDLKRDPFSAPSDADQARKGDLVEDIGVKGWVRSGGKMLVVVTDSRGNVRTLPRGYRFRNGVIASITEKAVTFHVWEIGSTNTSVYRTLVKTYKREEGKP